MTITVNGEETRHRVEARTLLVHYLRGILGLTGTHVGCDSSQCGACVVLMDGAPVKSCSVLAVQADGALIETVESLAGPGGRLHAVQSVFREEIALQCGFCAPGLLMTAVALLRSEADADEAAVRGALSGSLCLCTGYDSIVRSILEAVRRAKEERPATDGGS